MKTFTTDQLAGKITAAIATMKSSIASAQADPRNKAAGMAAALFQVSQAKVWIKRLYWAARRGAWVMTDGDFDMADKQLEMVDSEEYITSPEDADAARGAVPNPVKPCAHCGSPPIGCGMRNINTNNNVWKIMCIACGSSLSTCDNPMEKARAGAIAAWNKRV